MEEKFYDLAPNCYKKDDFPHRPTTRYDVFRSIDWHNRYLVVSIPFLYTILLTLYPTLFPIIPKLSINNPKLLTPVHKRPLFGEFHVTSKTNVGSQPIITNTNKFTIILRQCGEREVVRWKFSYYNHIRSKLKLHEIHLF